MEILLSLSFILIVIPLSLVIRIECLINKRFKELDLSQKVKLKYLRLENNNYKVLFYNPVVKDWWIIPSIINKDLIKKRLWSFRTNGAVYSINNIFNDDYKPFTILLEEKVVIEHRFKTLDDIQNHFNIINGVYTNPDRDKQYPLEL